MYLEAVLEHNLLKYICPTSRPQDIISRLDCPEIYLEESFNFSRHHSPPTPPIVEPLRFFASCVPSVRRYNKLSAVTACLPLPCAPLQSGRYSSSTSLVSRFIFIFLGVIYYVFFILFFSLSASRAWHDRTLKNDHPVTLKLHRLACLPAIFYLESKILRYVRTRVLSRHPSIAL